MVRVQAGPLLTLPTVGVLQGSISGRPCACVASLATVARTLQECKDGGFIINPVKRKCPSQVFVGDTNDSPFHPLLSGVAFGLAVSTRSPRCSRARVVCLHSITQRQLIKEVAQAAHPRRILAPLIGQCKPSSTPECQCFAAKLAVAYCS